MDVEDRTEEPGTGIDLGGEAPGDAWDGAEDPLAEGELPPGVELGELPGDNPSEEEEIPADPDDRDAAPDPDEEYPQAEAGEPDDVGVPAEPPEVEEAELAEAKEVEEKPKRKGRKKGKGKKSSSNNGMRGYIILREGSRPGTWAEVFEREDPDKPVTITQRNGKAALREAYRLLAAEESEPQSYKLLAIPETQWTLREVAGRVHKQTAISIK